MDTNFWVSQIIGIFTTAAGAISMHLKKMTYVMIAQLFANGLLGITYMLLGNWSGVWIFVTGTIQSLTVFFFQRKGKTPPIYLLPVFCAAYIACSVLTWTGIPSLLPMIGALLFAFALQQKNPTGYRFLSIANCAVWIGADFVSRAYTSILTHGIVLVSAIVGAVRERRNRKKEKEKEDGPGQTAVCPLSWRKEEACGTAAGFMKKRENEVYGNAARRETGIAFFPGKTRLKTQPGWKKEKGEIQGFSLNT